jgi:hypothetical protein
VPLPEHSAEIIAVDRTSVRSDRVNVQDVTDGGIKVLDTGDLKSKLYVQTLVLTNRFSPFT